MTTMRKEFPITHVPELASIQETRLFLVQLLRELQMLHKLVLSDIQALEARVVTTTADITAGSFRIILADGTSNTVDVTLPPAARVTDTVFYVKALNISNAVSIETNGAETIDGAANYVFGSQYDAVQVVSDGANWWLV